MGNTQILNQMAGSIEKRRVPRDCCYIFCTCLEERHCLKVCPCGLCDISKCKCEACGVRLSSTSPSFSHERLQANIDSAFARTESNSTSSSSCSISSIEQPSKSKPVYQNSYFETCDHPVTPAAIEMGPPKVVELMSSQSSIYSCCARCSTCAKKRRSRTRTCSQGCGALYDYDTSQSEIISHGRDRTLSSVERQQTSGVTTHSERSPSSFSQVSSKPVNERRTHLESWEAVILDKSTQCRPETNELQTQTLAYKQDRKQQTGGAESKTLSSTSKTFTSSTSSKAIQSYSSSADIERNQKLKKQESLLKKQQSEVRSSRSKTSTSSTATPIESDSRSDSYGRVQMLVNMDCDSEPESKPVPSATCSPQTPEPLQLSIRLRSKSEQKKSRSSRSSKSLDQEIFQVRRRQLEHGYYSSCYRNDYYRQYAH